MEVVLLWLDDLDDAVFSVALRWGCLRRTCLQMGLAAAFGLIVADALAVPAEFAVPLGAVAISSVAVWLCGAAFRVYYYREWRPLPDAA
jgi:hypothetical protein